MSVAYFVAIAILTVALENRISVKLHSSPYESYLEDR